MCLFWLVCRLKAFSESRYKKLYWSDSRWKLDSINNISQQLMYQLYLIAQPLPDRHSAFWWNTTDKIDQFHRRGHSCSSAFGYVTSSKYCNAALKELFLFLFVCWNNSFEAIKDQICPGLDTSAAEQVLQCNLFDANLWFFVSRK